MSKEKIEITDKASFNKEALISKMTDEYQAEVATVFKGLYFDTGKKHLGLCYWDGEKSESVDFNMNGWRQYFQVKYPLVNVQLKNMIPSFNTNSLRDYNIAVSKYTDITNELKDFTKDYREWLKKNDKKEKIFNSDEYIPDKDLGSAGESFIPFDKTIHKACYDLIQGNFVVNENNNRRLAFYQFDNANKSFRSFTTEEMINLTGRRKNEIVHNNKYWLEHLFNSKLPELFISNMEQMSIIKANEDEAKKFHEYIG